MSQACCPVPGRSPSRHAVITPEGAQGGRPCCGGRCGCLPTARCTLVLSSGGTSVWDLGSHWPRLTTWESSKPLCPYPATHPSAFLRVRSFSYVWGPAPSHHLSCPWGEAVCLRLGPRRAVPGFSPPPLAPSMLHTAAIPGLLAQAPALTPMNPEETQWPAKPCEI